MVARTRDNKNFNNLLLCTFFLGVKERHEEVFAQPAAIELWQGKLGGCW